MKILGLDNGYCQRSLHLCQGKVRVMSGNVLFVGTLNLNFQLKYSITCLHMLTNLLLCDLHVLPYMVGGHYFGRKN